MQSAATSARQHLACPLCGALTARTHQRFPHCRACGELLVKCRYCAQFDFKIMDCAHPFLTDQIHVSDPDLFTECQYHNFARPKSIGLPPRARVRRLGLAGGVAIAAAILAAVFYRVGQSPSQKVFAMVTAPDQLSVGAMGQLRVLILNRGKTPVRETMVALERPFLSKFECRWRELTPPPTQMRPASGMRYLYFQGLQPGEHVNIVLPVVARKPGAHRFRYQVFTEEGMVQRGDAAVTVLP